MISSVSTTRTTPPPPLTPATTPKKLTCFFCARPFRLESSLHDHLKTHVCHDERLDCFCYECNPREAEAHVEQIYERYLHVRASEIDRTSIAYLNRLYHCRFKRLDNPRYTCDQCGVIFQGLAVFVKHMQTHAKNKKANDKPQTRHMFYCPKCQLPYRAATPYVKHLKKHLIAIIRFNGIKERGAFYDFSEESYDPTGSLQCPVTNCGATPKTDLLMIVHMEEHLNDLDDVDLETAAAAGGVGISIPTKGRPGGSGRTFSRLSSSIAKVRERQSSTMMGRMSESEANFEAVVDDDDDDKAAGAPVGLASKSCEKEAEETKGETSGNDGDGGEPQLACSDCGKDFSLPSALVKHRIEDHGGVKSWSCAICWRRLGDSEALISHVEQVHDPIANRKRRLATSRLIDASSIADDDVKDLELYCDPCQLDFNSYKELLKHQHYVHNRVEKKCRICWKVVNSYPSLIGHVNGHDRDGDRNVRR